MPEFLARTPIAEAPLSLLLMMEGDAASQESALGRWIAYAQSLGRDYEILLVGADGKDRADPWLEAGWTQQPHVRLLGNVTSLGVAFRTGLAAAQHPLFFYSECSSRYEPADLQALLELIDRVDLVAGYRVWQNGRLRRSWREWAFRWLMRWTFGVHCKDPDCSFKLFRRSIFERIPIQSEGSFVHSEILAKANFLGCLMAEVPVVYRQLADGETKESSDLGQNWQEAYRLFRAPDFGPPTVPEQKAASC